jgi:hypothetical protein
MLASGQISKSWQIGLQPQEVQGSCHGMSQWLAFMDAKHSSTHGSMKYGHRSCHVFAAYYHSYFLAMYNYGLVGAAYMNIRQPGHYYFQRRGQL